MAGKDAATTRIDNLVSLCKRRGIVFPSSESYGGQVEEDSGVHYLRPETAQGIFVTFLNVMTAARKKPPFGIAQTGKSFRNEITPGNFIFRTREFEQMEMEFFVKPGTDEEWHEYWLAERTRWYTDLGINKDNLRHYEHPKEKLSHYSKRTVDIEYRYNFTGAEWAELEDGRRIGRRYRRQDEIGTPFCITVDFDTLTDNAVTVRERDSMAQERVGIDQVESYLAAKLLGC